MSAGGAGYAQMGTSIGGAIMAGIGTLMQRTPDVPAWQDVSLAEETEKAVKGAEAALPGIKSLFKEIDTFMSSELMRGMETLVPGSTATVARSITDMLQGKLPSDMVKNLASSANARMLGLTGTAKSQFRDFYGVEKLGELGFKYQQQGFQNLLAYGQALNPQPMNPALWLATPFQQAELTMQNRQNMWQRNMLAEQMETLDENKWANAVVLGGTTLASSGGGGGMFGGGGGGGSAPSGGNTGSWGAPDWSKYPGTIGGYG